MCHVPEKNTASCHENFCAVPHFVIDAYIVLQMKRTTMNTMNMSVEQIEWVGEH